MCSLEKYIGDLEEELKLEYDRTMNRISFDKVVMSHPEEFSYITLPPKDPEYVPQKGKPVSLVYMYLDRCGQRNEFPPKTLHSPLHSKTPVCFIYVQGVFPFLTLLLRRTEMLLSSVPC